MPHHDTIDHFLHHGSLLWARHADQSQTSPNDPSIVVLKDPPVHWPNPNAIVVLNTHDDNFIIKYSEQSASENQPNASWDYPEKMSWFIQRDKHGSNKLDISPTAWGAYACTFLWRGSAAYFFTCAVLITVIGTLLLLMCISMSPPHLSRPSYPSLLFFMFVDT